MLALLSSFSQGRGSQSTPRVQEPSSPRQTCLHPGYDDWLASLGDQPTSPTYQQQPQRDCPASPRDPMACPLSPKAWLAQKHAGLAQQDALHENDIFSLSWWPGSAAPVEDAAPAREEVDPGAALHGLSVQPGMFRARYHAAYKQEDGYGGGATPDRRSPVGAPPDAVVQPSSGQEHPDDIELRALYEQVMGTRGELADTPGMVASLTKQQKAFETRIEDRTQQGAPKSKQPSPEAEVRAIHGRLVGYSSYSIVTYDNKRDYFHPGSPADRRSPTGASPEVDAAPVQRFSGQKRRLRENDEDTEVLQEKLRMSEEHKASLQELNASLREQNASLREMARRSHTAPSSPLHTLPASSPAASAFSKLLAPVDVPRSARKAPVPVLSNAPWYPPVYAVTPSVGVPPKPHTPPPARPPSDPLWFPFELMDM